MAKEVKMLGEDEIGILRGLPDNVRIKLFFEAEFCDRLR